MNLPFHLFMADDDVEDRYIMEMVFAELGLSGHVRYFEDGTLLMDHLRHIGLEPLPGVIVLDLNMPKLSGVETLRLLKEDLRFRDIPVIIFSTSLNEMQLRQCKELGADSYVLKPITYDEYVEIGRRFFAFCQQEYVFPFQHLS